MAARWARVASVVRGPDLAEIDERRWGPGGRAHFADPRPGNFPGRAARRQAETEPPTGGGMSTQPEPEYEWSPEDEIDFSDPWIAWNFGTRELTEEEYERCKAVYEADYARWAAAADADKQYAAWAKANPAEAAAQREAAAAAQAAADPYPWGPRPEPEAEAG